MPLQRDFLTDYALMTEQDRPGAPGPTAGGDPSPGGPAAGAAGATAPAAGASAVQYGGTGLARQIVSVARGLIGTLNRLYYARDDAEACASFVSTVLIRAGAVRGTEQQEGPGFTRSANRLTELTEHFGAVNATGMLPLTDANARLGQPGDVVQWAKNGRIHHSGICAGNGETIAIGSSHGKVTVYKIAYRGADFDHLQFHRFTR